MPEKYPSVAGYEEYDEIVWTPNTGDVRTLTWDGSTDDVYNTFLARRAAAPGTADVFELAYRSARGKATLIERRMREDGNLIEELLGIDVMKDVLTSAYFATLTNADVVEVRRAYESMAGEGASPFTGKKASLYYHLIHGVEMLPETAWVFSSVTRAVRHKTVAASFANVNTVVSAPAIDSSSIQKLVTAIPAGEWLKKPPRVTSAGKGKYDIAQEYWWARTWSVALGGTFGAPP